MDKEIQRPVSVAVIAYAIIIYYSYGFVRCFMGMLRYANLQNSQLPETFSVGMAIAISALWMVMYGIASVSGIAILKGFNWGRILYLSIVPVKIFLSGLLCWLSPGGFGKHVFGLGFHYGFYGLVVTVVVLGRSVILPAILYIAVFIFLRRPGALAFFGIRNSGK